MDAMMQALMGAGGAGAQAGAGVNMPLPDSAETVHISSLALLKMLKHGASATLGRYPPRRHVPEAVVRRCGLGRGGAVRGGGVASSDRLETRTAAPQLPPQGAPACRWR